MSPDMVAAKDELGGASTLTTREQIYSKMSAEYGAFVAELKSLPPEDAVKGAYEKVFKHDILTCFDNECSFDDAEIAVLLTLDNPLEALYRNWLGSDVSYFDMLRENISDYAKKEIKWQNTNDVGAST
jgi:hypothetical protein